MVPYFLSVISCSDIQKGPIKLLIVDVELRLMKYAVVPIAWSLAFLYLLHTGMPVQI